MRGNSGVTSLLEDSRYVDEVQSQRIVERVPSAAGRTGWPCLPMEGRSVSATRPATMSRSLTAEPAGKSRDSSSAVCRSGWSPQPCPRPGQRNHKFNGRGLSPLSAGGIPCTVSSNESARREPFGEQSCPRAYRCRTRSGGTRTGRPHLCGGVINCFAVTPEQAESRPVGW